MKEFITNNVDKFKRYPIPFIALLFMGLYANELTENREDYRNCQEELKRKDQELAAEKEYTRNLNGQLMEYAFKIRMMSEETDSIIRRETERNVNKLLRR